MQKNKGKNILVIRTTAMGDVAMTVPVIEQFLEQTDNVKIIFLTSAPFVQFFRYIDSNNITIEVAQLHKRHEGIKGIWRLYKDLSSNYEIDEILDLQVKLYSRLLSLFFKLFKGIKTIRIDKAKEEKEKITRRENKERSQLLKMHYRYGDVFKAAGFDVTFNENPYKQRFEPIPEAYSFLEGEKMIGFSPMASHEGKQLPLPVVRSVIELLIERLPDYKILIFGGGKYEKMVGTSLESFYSGHVYSTIGKMNISLEMDLMSNLDVMISMDSSAQHICALLGTKVVSVWGATQPETGYLGYGFTKENVVSLHLGCSPCSVYGDKPCYKGSMACLTEMKAEQIVDKVEEFVKKS